MTSHELANLLLEAPDLEVRIEGCDGCWGVVSDAGVVSPHQQQDILLVRNGDHDYMWSDQ